MAKIQLNGKKIIIKSNFSIMDLLRKKYDLVFRLNSVKHYFLLDKGDFFVHFMNVAGKELNKSIADITDQINSYKNKLEIANDKGQINDSTYQVKMGLINNMSTQLTNIQSSVKRITIFESSFQLKNKKMDKVWIGENTKSNELMKKIEYSINDVNNGIAKIKAISAKLNETDQE